MSTGHRWRLCVFVLAVSCLAPSVSAEIIVVREYRGEQACAYSGLVGVAKVCGTEGYVRVFTGTIKSSVEIAGTDDKILELIPDEVFLGDSSEVTATTNQACLGAEIHAGDKWLFYLDRDTNNNALILSYDGPSKPIVCAQDDISMLRDLGRLTNAGILMGTVQRLGKTHDAPFANRTVIAKRMSDGTEYAVHTNGNGYFKFELPAGSYDVTVALERGVQEVESFPYMLRGSIPVEKRECLQHNFTLKQTAKHIEADSKLPPSSSTR
jgi:hypothetical protein